jgi:hypothetical protein
MRKQKSSTETAKVVGQLDCFNDAPCVAVEEQWTVERDGCADLRFVGTRITEQSSWEQSGPRNGRWEVIALYRTHGDNWVCARVQHMAGDRHQVSRDVEICISTGDLVDFLGCSALAKRVYAVAGIECVEWVA